MKNHKYLSISSYLGSDKPVIGVWTNSFGIWLVKMASSLVIFQGRCVIAFACTDFCVVRLNFKASIGVQLENSELQPSCQKLRFYSRTLHPKTELKLETCINIYQFAIFFSWPKRYCKLAFVQVTRFMRILSESCYYPCSAAHEIFARHKLQFAIKFWIRIGHILSQHE